MKKIMSTILCFMMLLGSMGANVFAAEDISDEKPISVTVYSTDLEGNLIAIDGVPVDGVDYDGMTGYENIRPYNAWGVSQENTRKYASYTGRESIFSGSGSYGGTIKMHTSVSYSTTLTGGFGISAGEFNANMGFSSTSSITLGVDYDYYVTSSKARIDAYPIIYMYSFDCYYLGSFKSTGYAEAPRGVDYVVTRY